jgi:hypothetical protein
MEPTEGSETSAFNFRTPRKYPEEYLPHPQHGENLKTMIPYTLLVGRQNIIAVSIYVRI